MEFEFLTFLGLLLFGAPLVVFIILITKMSSMNNALENISFDISTLQTMIEKMQQEGIKQTAQTTETKPKDDLEKAEEQSTEAPKEEPDTLGSRNPYWWQEPVKIETEIVNETETTENKTEDIQMEAVETPENVEVPEPVEVPETTETVVTQNEDVRPSTVEIPVMDTEEKNPETEEEEPEAVEEPVEENEEEPAMTMEEEPEMETEEEYTVSETNYEKYIGENLFGKIGILIFIIGIGFFVKYAIDQNWINETARTILGYAVGAGMLVLAERLHKRYHTFSSLLAGGAFGIYYLITAIAFHYYDLFSQTTAFAILCATTIFMTVVSILYDRKELAVTALIGGFIAPFIISTDSDSIIALQTYISILNIGMFCLAMYKKWGILPVISFCFTYIILWWALVTTSFIYNDTTTSYEALFAFATLFYIIFLLPVVFILRTKCSDNMRSGLLTIITANSFMYLAYGNYVAQHCETTFYKGGFVAFLIAGVNLAIHLYLRFRVEGQNTLRNLMLALAIAFLSIGIPMQFDTDNILMIWAAEAVLLLWLFTKEKSRIYEFGFIILSFLTFATLLYYRFTVMITGHSGDSLFFNENFFVNMFVSVACFATAIIMEYNKELFSDSKSMTNYSPCNVIAYILGFIILFLAFWDDFHAHLEQLRADYASLLMANVILLGGALALCKRFEIYKYKTAYDISIYLATGLYAIAVWNLNTPDELTLRWAMTLVTIIYITYSMRGLLLAGLNQTISNDVLVDENAQEGTSAKPVNKQQHTEFAIISTLVWITVTRLLMLTFNIYDFTTAFSLSLGVAAFILMCIGMRYHSKQVRLVSLAEFGIIIGKLVLNDVWAMSALGKIIVFISLGAILLTLSFLYQKLKDALFEEEEKEQE